MNYNKTQKKKNSYSPSSKNLYTLEDSTKAKIAAVPLQMTRNTENFKNEEFHRRKTNPSEDVNTWAVVRYVQQCLIAVQKRNSWLPTIDCSDPKRKLRELRKTPMWLRTKNACCRTLPLWLQIYCAVVALLRRKKPPKTNIIMAAEPTVCVPGIVLASLMFHHLNSDSDVVRKISRIIWRCIFSSRCVAYCRISEAGDES